MYADRFNGNAILQNLNRNYTCPLRHFLRLAVIFGAESQQDVLYLWLYNLHLHIGKKYVLYRSVTSIYCGRYGINAW